MQTQYTQKRYHVFNRRRYINVYNSYTFCLMCMHSLLKCFNEVYVVYFISVCGVPVDSSSFIFICCTKHFFSLSVYFGFFFRLSRIMLNIHYNVYYTLPRNMFNISYGYLNLKLDFRYLIQNICSHTMCLCTPVRDRER